MRVLVVDDEKLIRDVIKEYLLLENIKVDEAENGLQAVDKVKHNDYDIIIMDIMMPKMDGYTACREIKKIKDIPFIMLSARGEEYDKLIGFDLGIDSPIAPKELIDINPLAEYKIPYDFMKSFDFDVPHQVWVNYVKQRMEEAKQKKVENKKGFWASLFGR